MERNPQPRGTPVTAYASRPSRLHFGRNIYLMCYRYVSKLSKNKIAKTSLFYEKFVINQTTKAKKSSVKSKQRRYWRNRVRFSSLRRTNFVCPSVHDTRAVLPTIPNTCGLQNSELTLRETRKEIITHNALVDLDYDYWAVELCSHVYNHCGGMASKNVTRRNHDDDIVEQCYDGYR